MGGRVRWVLHASLSTKCVGHINEQSRHGPHHHRAHILENNLAEFLVASLEEQFCGYTKLFLNFHHPKFLCFFNGYFNALAHVLDAAL